MAYLWVTLIFALILVHDKVTVEAACQNTLSRENTIEVLDNDGNILETVAKCKTIMKKYPDVCERLGGEDKPCCKACGDPTCLDKLGPFAPYILGSKVYTSCKKLVKKQKSVCKSLSGSYRKCCRSCQGIDTSCVDEVVELNGMNCEELVKSDRCYCTEEPVKSKCCETCSKQKQKRLAECNCRDYLDDSPILVNITDTEGTQIALKEVNDCKEIVSYYAGYCAGLGREKMACCKSCKGIDPSCYDNLAWRVTVNTKKRSCDNCNCHELRAKGSMLMKYVCKNDLMGDNSQMKAREACCLQCNRVGY